jgi:biotin synthase
MDIRILSAYEPDTYSRFTGWQNNDQLQNHQEIRQMDGNQSKTPGTTFENAQKLLQLEHLATGIPRTNWTLDEVRSIYSAPFADLMHAAQQVHRQNFDPNEVQISTLCSVKTGGCPEDCGYCPQSIRYNTDVENEPLMELDEVIANATAAKQEGATRFCMGAAWRSPKPKQMDQIVAMVEAVNDLGMETCATLGMLQPEQAQQLKDAGLDYYNHNLDTSANYYKQIITTRTYQNRLDTLQSVRDAGLKVCCGGIVGMGEEETDRADLLHTLATLPEHPGSVPINQLVQVEGTPLAETRTFDALEFVRMIATARILMPRSHVRLSAGRENMDDSTQALCFLAGANSIFYGEKLLTTGNPETEADRQLMAKLGINPEPGKANESSV